MKANFVRKASTISELKDAACKGGRSEYVIEAVVELEQAEYEHFANNLLDDFEFIGKHITTMFQDSNNVWHCLFVKAVGAKEGILVESEGYDYARYAAYFADECVAT